MPDHRKNSPHRNKNRPAHLVKCPAAICPICKIIRQLHDSPALAQLCRAPQRRPRHESLLIGPDTAKGGRSPHSDHPGNDKPPHDYVQFGPVTRKSRMTATKPESRVGNGMKKIGNRPNNEEKSAEQEKTILAGTSRGKRRCRPPAYKGQPMAGTPQRTAIANANRRSDRHSHGISADRPWAHCMKSIIRPAPRPSPGRPIS